MKDWESIVLPLVALMAAFLLIALALFLARKLAVLLEKRHKSGKEQPLQPPDNQQPPE